jgi:hypothetical protein
MAGKPRQQAFVGPRWKRAIKAKFLDFGFRNNPDALKRLTTEVKSGEITASAWAKSYDLGGTWVESWAEHTLSVWELRPDLCPENLFDVRYPPPDDEHTQKDIFKFSFRGVPDAEHTHPEMFKFSFSGVPESKLSLGLTLGGAFGNNAEDDWERFRQQARQKLDLALDQYRAKPSISRASSEMIPPKDLDLKVETAALYFFGQKTPEKLRPHLVSTVGDRTTVNRWLKAIVVLLQLKLRQRGHLAKTPDVARD